MKDKGILFTRKMAEAANNGSKTQTRRRQGLEEINKEPDAWAKPHWNECMQFWSFLHIAENAVVDLKCPFAVDQRLYLKEAHYRYGKWVKNGLTKKTKEIAWRFVPLEAVESMPYYFEDNVPDRVRNVVHPDACRIPAWYKRSSLFMPKKLARSWWIVTDVGCQRVQDITLAGIRDEMGTGTIYHFKPVQKGIEAFAALWDSIHGDGAWEKNEWVFYPTFKKIRRPE